MKNTLIHIVVIYLLFITGCSRHSDENSFKVMTFNVRYDNPADSINAWPRRADQVCNFIQKENPDILGMQEVLWSQYMLMDSVLTGYTSVGVGRDDGAKGGEMNPVFFKKEKFDMVRTITFWLSDTPEVPGSMGWGASLPRIVTWMELVNKSNHEHFFFFNTHFANDSDSARTMSSAILLKEVKMIAEGFPFVITGDFNMIRTSQAYAIITGPAESVPLLKDSYLISEKKPSGSPYTFNGFSDETGKSRIDYIFVKNGMRVLEYKTFMKKDHGIFISDHWPVEAVISVK
jgi:endonuclease/exonuclease/phosphatase family metal-dependent hydrolase